MYLPPARHCDHRIPLKASEELVKVRSYRYPHSEKTEIYKMASPILQEGLIETSNSPFSIMMILVKKKDRA